MEVPGDDPLVAQILKEVVRHGQTVVAFIEGTLLTVCCAVTHAVLFIFDLACLPCHWLGHCWGFAVDWAVRNAGGGGYAVGTTEKDDSGLRALEEGVRVAVEDPPQTAPPSPTSARQQHRTLSGGSSTCGVTPSAALGHEVSYTR